MQKLCLLTLILGLSFTQMAYAQDFSDLREKRPASDVTYWPLTTSIIIASSFTGVQLGLANGWILTQQGNAPTSPNLEIAVGGMVALTVGSVIGGICLSSIADSIARGTWDTHTPDETDTDHTIHPLDPAYAASIGSGIYWGALYGAGLSMLLPTVTDTLARQTNQTLANVVLVSGYGLATLGAAPLGGYVASLLPPPKHTAQVGLRNLGGTLGYVTAALFSGSTLLSGRDIPNVSVLQSTVPVILPILGLVAGDLAGQTSDLYVDTDVFWAGLGAAGGALVSGATIAVTMSAIQSANVPVPTLFGIFSPVLVGTGMYAGAGLTLWGLASAHAAQAE